jgi:hypothetical protein
MVKFCTLFLLLALAVVTHSMIRSHFLQQKSIRKRTFSISDTLQKYGEDNFGDIMQGGCETNVLVSGEFSNTERIVITANGNLQRIMSAYYGCPITVKVKKSDLTSRLDSVAKYDREVDLLVNGKIFCTAVSDVSENYHCIL